MTDTKTLALLNVAIPVRSFEFSEDFLKFIYHDEMNGISDLFAMTKNESASKRIPANIRSEYEQHYHVAGELLDTIQSELQKKLDKIQAAKENGDSEIILDHPDVLMDDSGIIITNVLPVEDELIDALKNSIEKFKQDYETTATEMKVSIIDGAVLHFLAERSQQGSH